MENEDKEQGVSNQGANLAGQSLTPGAYTDRPLSYGQRAVGFDFNPSGNMKVQKIKSLFAEIIDIMAGTRMPNPNGSSPEVARLSSIAITEAQGAQMWAVKAITWKD